ncbi:DUF3352 domain-containing protein [Trichormus variabilis]|uniref:DUF3352 domain-containing protein n=1 Tax=Anabaena variabilis TaxID=264691 RepID=UPI000F8F348F|nr:DUF3352 domain-containing protein [Trichormus variabilis]MBD2625332.1 DUF3352 domain-containing protein [Trichormus variabilis FACHB-164]
MNSQSSFFRFLVAGAIALLLFSIAGFYWFFAKSPIGLLTSRSQPGAAVFVSKLSPVIVSLLVNPDGLQGLEQKGEISQIKTNLLAKTSINYQEDIKPWLGNEITLAVTSQDIDRDPENGLQSGYLMALATDNPAQSREFIELLFSKRSLAGANLAVEQYKGVKLLYDTPETPAPAKIQTALAGAVVDNFVLFANDAKVLREAINNVQAPDLNLTNSPEYEKATQQIPKDAVAVAFLNLPEVAKWQGFELAESTYNSQILSLVLNPQGLLAESTFLTSTEVTPPSASLSKPVGALQYIPASASLAISGANLSNLADSDLAKLWKQGTATIYGSSAEAISRWIQPLVDVQKDWGLNFREDIFSWVVGEYAIATLTENNAPVPNQGNTTPNWVFVVEKTPQLVEGIARLDKIARSFGLNVSSLTLNQQTVFAWTELTAITEDKSALSVAAKIQGVHTSQGNYEIFTSDLKTMDKVLSSKEKSLIDNPNFQDVIAPIPQLNQGYIYVDWEKSQKLLERQLPLLKFVEVLGKPLFKDLRSLTVSSYSREPGTLKGGVFFQLHRS